MASEFKCVEFLDDGQLAKARQCRKMAIEAALLAELTPEVRATYLELKRQFTTLADEIERSRLPLPTTADMSTSIP